MRTVSSKVLAISLLFGVGACVPDDLTVTQDYSQQDSRDTQQRSVDVEGIHLTVVSYSIIFSDFRGVKPKAKGYFLVVNYSVENRSSLHGYFDPKISSAVTKEIGEYKLSDYGTDDFTGVNDKIHELPIDATTAGTLLFEMPAGSVPDFLVFNMPNSDETKIIDLKDPDA